MLPAARCDATGTTVTAGSGPRSAYTGRVIARLWKVAHRGASAELPENTLPAFERAVERGADVIEADVRVTKDGKLLVLHDADVDRTTDGAGPLRAMTAVAARKLDAGGGAPLPTPAEVLDVARRGGVRVNLDLKEPEAVVPAAALVRELDMTGSVSFISFRPDVWEALEDANPGCPVIHLVDSASGLASQAMGDVGTRSGMAGVGVPAALVTPALVERMHRHGQGVFAWTVDDDAEMRRLIGIGVNGIVTNRIGALVEVERQLRAG
jgi:glycerophosphoryl diester phosphodiesterase